MNRNYKKFFTGCYMNTNGFIPAKPLTQFVFPGDFFQIRNGEMIVLGNIFRSGIVDTAEVQINRGIKLHHSAWSFSEGMSKPYSGRGHGQGPIEGHFEYSRQKLRFDNPGSYSFKGSDPVSWKIANWNQLQQQCIIKLTQTVFSFRELYLVTETAIMPDWTLAVAGSENADLEIATDSENFGLLDIFGQTNSKTIQLHGMEYYHRETSGWPAFYKAKKLQVQEEKLNIFISELISERQRQTEWASDFFNYDPTPDSLAIPLVSRVAPTSMLDMLQANELNPATALLYFRWADAGLEDIEKLFAGYGNN